MTNVLGNRNINK